MKLPANEVAIEEVFHLLTEKDAPSGTADHTWLKGLLHPQAPAFATGNSRKLLKKEGGVAYLNLSKTQSTPAQGTHAINYSSAIDSIEIIHTAHSQRRFWL